MYFHSTNTALHSVSTGGLSLIKMTNDACTESNVKVCTFMSLRSASLHTIYSYNVRMVRLLLWSSHRMYLSLWLLIIYQKKCVYKKRGLSFFSALLLTDDQFWILQSWECWNQKQQPQLCDSQSLSLNALPNRHWGQSPGFHFQNWVDTSGELKNKSSTAKGIQSLKGGLHVKAVILCAYCWEERGEEWGAKYCNR